MLRENVRISDAGYRLLNNKELANKVAASIVSHKEELKNGVEIKVDNLYVQLVSSLESDCEEKEADSTKDPE